MATCDAKTSLTMASSVSALPKANISEIKNKMHRREVYREMKIAARKEKIKMKKKKKEQDKLLGDKAPPKQIPHTLDNQRVPDETMVSLADDEVMLDEAQDDMAPYFNRETTPKILITTSDTFTNRTFRFCHELKKIIPNSDVKLRKHIALKKIIPQAIARDYTDLIVINENEKVPNGLVLSHLPEGPTAHFKLTNIKFSKEIKDSGASSDHYPEIILNNFNTRLGHSVGRLLATLFPHDPQFTGRRVCTFHNQRDYIFFRHHRYQFKEKSKLKCGVHELGPRFTLKLRSLQKGTFDSKFGEYEFYHKRHEMETSRRKFFL